jgi:hypothetical protein
MSGAAWRATQVRMGLDLGLSLSLSLSMWLLSLAKAALTAVASTDASYARRVLSRVSASISMHGNMQLGRMGKQGKRCLQGAIAKWCAGGCYTDVFFLQLCRAGCWSLELLLSRVDCCSSLGPPLYPTIQSTSNALPPQPSPFTPSRLTPRHLSPLAVQVVAVGAT